MRIRRDLFGDRHPDTAMSLNTLATYADALGDQQRALDLARQGLAIQRCPCTTDRRSGLQPDAATPPVKASASGRVASVTEDRAPRSRVPGPHPGVSIRGML
jgi:hypothetical protein